MKLLEGKVLNPLDIESVSQCRLCINLGQDHCPSEGNAAANVMIIGQSPGATEVKLGRPFCGPSGELLDLMLADAGLDRSEVYITNVLKCRPPGNRSALSGEAGNCWRTWLSKEIKQLNPTYIVLVGRDAHTTLLPPRFVFGHKKVVKSKKGRVYISTYHPSWFLRQNNPMGFVEFGQFLKEILEGKN